jgi:predicted transglutaminase-like cysteine proteinase
MRRIVPALGLTGALMATLAAGGPAASEEDAVALAPAAPAPMQAAVPRGLAAPGARLPELRIWASDRLAQWASLAARVEAERAAPPSRETRAWLRALARLEGQPLDRQVEAVNAIVNAGRWVSDEDNYGSSDLWATPGQFLARGGDCEDYAVAKFFSLARLGVAPERMRILVVHDAGRDLVHAVLALATERGMLVLDNLNPEVLPFERVPHYRPLYSVNLDNLWLHDTLR